MQNMGSIVPGVAAGVASSIVTDRIKDKANETIDESLGNKPARTHEDYLNDIHMVLVDLLTHFKHEASIQGDLFAFRTIYKATSGPSYIPQHISGRQHFRILTAQPTLLNVVAPGLGAFNVTTKAAPDWTVIDYPDGSQYTLDASVGTNQITVWEQETNSSVV